MPHHSARKLPEILATAWKWVSMPGRSCLENKQLTENNLENTTGICTNAYLYELEQEAGQVDGKKYLPMTL